MFEDHMVYKIFDAMPHVFWKNTEGVYLGCNLHQAKAFGFNCIDEFIGKTVFDLCDKQTAKRINAIDNKIMQDGVVSILEESITTNHGEKIYLSQKMPYYNSDGSIIGMIGFSMDITEIKHAEKTANKKSQELQLLVQQCLDSIQNALFLCKVNVVNKQIGANFKINYEKKPITLTKREKEILFYLSLNKSPKDIANILSTLENKQLSSLTISSIIDKQLYPKFEVFSVSALIEKAIMYRLIPFLA